MYGCFIAIVIQYYTVSTGELCGNCRDGYGVSVLLNKCVTCPSVSGILIAALSECINNITQELPVYLCPAVQLLQM